MWSINPAKTSQLSAAAALVASAALAGCAPTSAFQSGPSLTPTEQYSIQVEESPDELALNPHAEGLSVAQRAAVVSLVSRWRTTPGAGDIAVQSPSGAEDSATARTSAELLAALRALGVPGERIRAGDYDAKPGAPVLARYARLEARGPDCSSGWDNLTSTGSNRPSTHFGCAVTANIAAQIADPRDLLGPAPETAADPGRRQVVLGKYRSGETTSTQRDEQATGTVSKAVN